MLEKYLKQYVIAETVDTVTLTKKNFKSICKMLEDINPETLKMMMFFDGIDREITQIKL